MKNMFIFIKSGSLAASAFFLFFMWACSENSEPPEGFVAQVNNEYLLNAELDYSIPVGMDKESSFSLKKNVITRWINREIFFQTAKKEGLILSDKDKYQVDQFYKTLLVQKFIDQKLNKVYRISDKDIEDYYQEHREEFKRAADEVHIVHLLLEHRDRAIFNEISQSKSLQEIIEKHYFNEKSTSLMPNKDLSFIALNSLPESFVKTLRRMKTGEISAPIKTEFGYHFLQLFAKAKAGSYRDLELIKKHIKLRLIRDKREKDKKALLESLKSNAQVQTYLSKIKNQVIE